MKVLAFTRSSTELHPSTSEHWSDHTPQHEHFTLLHQLAGWYHHHWEQTKLAQRSRVSSLFWHRPFWNELSTNVRNHSPSSAKTQDSFVQTLSLDHVLHDSLFFLFLTLSMVICCVYCIYVVVVSFLRQVYLCTVSRFGQVSANALNVNLYVVKTT